MSWRSGTELPDGEITCLCKYIVSDGPKKVIDYHILDSRPDGWTYKWIDHDDAYYYRQEEIIAWCPIDEVDNRVGEN